MDEMMSVILAGLKSVIANTSLSESFYKMVLKRLVSFGYSLQEEDVWPLSFCIQKVENHVKNSCNVDVVPDGLIQVAVDKACGEFLLAKNQTGQLDISGLDLTGAVTSIKEGDIQVNFGNGTSDEEKFQALVNWLIHNGEGDFACYRKLRW